MARYMSCEYVSAGLGDMLSGFGGGGGGSGPSFAPFFRFFGLLVLYGVAALVLCRLVGSGGGGLTSLGGGECEGGEDGGDMEVMSREGDRCRCVDERELGDGTSSGGGAGGNTK
jgi:hypothetical protein